MSRIIKTLALIGGAAVVGMTSFTAGLVSGIAIYDSEVGADARKRQAERRRTRSSEGKLDETRERKIAESLLRAYIIAKYKDDDNADIVGDGGKISIDSFTISTTGWIALIVSHFNNTVYKLVYDSDLGLVSIE